MANQNTININEQKSAILKMNTKAEALLIKIEGELDYNNNINLQKEYSFLTARIETEENILNGMLKKNSHKSATRSINNQGGNKPMMRM